MTGKGFGYVWGIALFCVAWELFGRIHHSIFFPPLSDVVVTFKDNWLVNDPSHLFLSHKFLDQGLVSIERVAVGWVGACVVGVIAGIIIGGSRSVQALVAFPVRFGVATPSTSLLPVALAFFGITDNMNMALIALGSVWPVLLNTIDGVRGIDVTARRTARSLGLGPVRSFFTVLLPGASPQIVTGMRVSVGTALVLMVVSELYAATHGIGYFLSYSSRQFSYRDMWSAVLLLAIIGIIANALFAVVEARMLRWHRMRESHGRAQ